LKITAAVPRRTDGPYALEEVELDPPGPGEPLVRAAGAGMCHTDVVPRQAESFSPPPIITGHEGSGVVEAVGEGMREVSHRGLVGIQTEPLVLDQIALLGKTVTGILVGGADPRVVIPRLIGLWREGRFPFDRLVETFPLAEINAVEEAASSRKVIKPVLIPSAAG
jgi:Zn-dependent alcohol dehydrogenase